MRRLSGFDSAALALETDSSPLHMTAVLLLDTSDVPGGYSYERLRDFLAARIHRVPPLLQRLVRVPAGVHRPVWVDAQSLDWGYHLPRMIDTEPLDLQRLAEIAAERAEQRLDRGQPLWQLLVVEDPAGIRVALIACVHHALMDGLGGMEFMASLFDLEPKEPRDEPPPEVEAPEAPSRLELLARAVVDLTALPADGARLALSSARTLANYAVAPSSDGQRAPRPFTAPRTRFNAKLTPARSVALTELRFQAVRDVAARNHATVNDVVLTIVSGALRNYLFARGLLPARRLIAGVPAATESADAAFGNSFSFLLVRLATDVEDPQERLAVVKREAQRAKQSAPLGMQMLTKLLDLFTPGPLDASIAAYRSLLVERIPPLWNVIVSNVPGPPVPLYVAGARLVGLFPLGPIYEGIGLNLTVISREESLDVGVVACRESVPDVDDLAALLAPALDELARSAAVHA
jgi:diacylglycerol O-acyltransferase